MRIVLDTNVLLVSVSDRSPYFRFDLIKKDRDDNKFVASGKHQYHESLMLIGSHNFASCRFDAVSYCARASRIDGIFVEKQWRNPIAFRRNDI